MKIYLAASFSRRDEIGRYGLALARRGAIVTSRWLTEAHEWTKATTIQDRNRFGSEDLEDIDASDVLVCFTHAADDPPYRNTGGRHVELGYAFAKGKTIWIVGPRENVFHWQMGRVRRLDDVHALLRAVEDVLQSERVDILN